MSEGRKPILAARVDPRILDRIEKLVDVTGASRTEVIERAMVVGLEDQEKLVGALQGPVRGPLVALLFNQKFLDLVFTLTGDEVDESQMKVIKNVRDKSKHRGRAAPGTAT
jgi:hypothetical protein